MTVLEQIIAAKDEVSAKRATYAVSAATFASLSTQIGDLDADEIRALVRILEISASIVAEAL